MDLERKLGIDVPVNPPKIIHIGNDSFTVDLNAMEPDSPCIVELPDFRYVVWKDQDDSMVMVDV